MTNSPITSNEEPHWSITLPQDAECRQVFNQLERLIQSKSDKEELESLKDQLEAKLKCMAKSFIGLQKFVAEEGEGDDGLSFKRNINQNRNETPPADPAPNKTPKMSPPNMVAPSRGWVKEKKVYFIL